MFFARAVALLVVLALAGPSVAAAACELTCALGSHHHGTSSPSEASCHEHESSTQSAGIGASSPGVCHESGDLPSALVDTVLSTLLLPSSVPATFVLDAVVVSKTIAQRNQLATLFDPRPAHRPLRV